MGFRWIAVAAVAVSTAVYAFATDWVFVSRSSGGPEGVTNIYIDRATIRQMPNGYKRAWSRITYRSHPRYTELQVLNEYDCESGRSRSVQLVSYMRDGDIQNTGIDLQPWEYAPPGTNLSHQFNFVCSRPSRQSAPSNQDISRSNEFVCCEDAMISILDGKPMSYLYRWESKARCRANAISERRPAPASRGCSPPTREGDNLCRCTNPARPTSIASD